MKRYIFLCLTVAMLLVVLLSGCGANGSGEQEVSTVFPVSFKAYTNPYSITGYEIGTDEKGNTVVTLYGSGYNKLSVDLFGGGGGGVKIPAWCKYESAGETHECLGATADRESLEYSFDTSAAPEIITFTHGETGESIVSFNVADEPQKNSKG